MRESRSKKRGLCTCIILLEGKRRKKVVKRLWNCCGGDVFKTIIPSVSNDATEVNISNQVSNQVSDQAENIE